MISKRNTKPPKRTTPADDTSGIRTRKVRFTGGGFAFPTPTADADPKPSRKRQSSGRDAIIVEGKPGTTHKAGQVTDAARAAGTNTLTHTLGKGKSKTPQPEAVVEVTPKPVKKSKKGKPIDAAVVTEPTPVQEAADATPTPIVVTPEKSTPAKVEGQIEGQTKAKKKKKAEAVPEVAEPIPEVAEPVTETAEPVTEAAEPIPEVIEPVSNVAEPIPEATPTEVAESVADAAAEESAAQQIEQAVQELTAAAKKKKKKKKKKAATEVTPPQPAKEQEIFVDCRFSYSGRGFGFAIPENPEESLGEDIFIYPRASLGAMSGDLVRVRVNRRPSTKAGVAHSAEGEVTDVLERACVSITGVLTIADTYAMVKPDNDKLRVLVYVSPEDCAMIGAQSGDKVEVVPDGEPAFTRSRTITVPQKPDRNPLDEIPVFDTRGKIGTVFGSGKSREANYASILHTCQIRTEFPTYVKTAAEVVAAQPLTYMGRVDLRDQILMTIDSADAKDLDDAVSLRKNLNGDWVLGVHIADVSHYVPYGSCLEKEARRRGTSVYFTDKVIPMLPEALSNGACSLNAGEDKYAITCEITLSPNGQRKKVEIYKSLLRTAVRGVYSEVNALLTGTEDEVLTDKYRLVLPMLWEMQTLYRVLKKQARSRGVLELSDTEARIVLDESGAPVEILRQERGDAEKIIEQFMLQANMAVAETLHSLELPCLYRTHDTPLQERLKSFATYVHNLGLPTFGLVNNKGVFDTSAGKTGLADKFSGILAEAYRREIGDIVSTVLQRTMAKAKYVAEPGAHFGLGAATYCHFTSPIRRYPDLFVHNVLTAVLPYTDNGRLRADTSLPPEAFPQTLATAAPERGVSSSETEINAQQAEWKIEDLYMALYMADKVGQIFDVTVVSVMKFGLFVQCENLVEGMIPTPLFPDAVVNEAFCTLRSCGALYTLGTKMQARLVEADPASGRITFAPLQTV